MRPVINPSTPATIDTQILPITTIPRRSITILSGDIFRLAVTPIFKLSSRIKEVNTPINPELILLAAPPVKIALNAPPTINGRHK